MFAKGSACNFKLSTQFVPYHIAYVWQKIRGRKTNHVQEARNNAEKDEFWFSLDLKLFALNDSVWSFKDTDRDDCLKGEQSCKKGRAIIHIIIIECHFLEIRPLIAYEIDNIDYHFFHYFVIMMMITITLIIMMVKRLLLSYYISHGCYFHHYRYYHHQYCYQVTENYLKWLLVMCWLSNVVKYFASL